jgi:hypothetical protein
LAALHTRGDAGGAARLGDLHGEVADASGGAVDEDGLAGEVAAQPKPVQRGQGGHRQTAASTKGRSLGLRRSALAGTARRSACAPGRPSP